MSEIPKKQPSFWRSSLPSSFPDNMLKEGTFCTQNKQANTLPLQTLLIFIKLGTTQILIQCLFWSSSKLKYSCNPYFSTPSFTSLYLRLQKLLVSRDVCNSLSSWGTKSEKQYACSYPSLNGQDVTSFKWSYPIDLSAHKVQSTTLRNRTLPSTENDYTRKQLANLLTTYTINC